MKFDPKTREIIIPLGDLYAAAEGLVAEDGENPEYDRAIYELLCAILGLPTQDGGREMMENQIAVARHLKLHERANPCD